MLYPKGFVIWQLVLNQLTQDILANNLLYYDGDDQQLLKALEWHDFELLLFAHPQILFLYEKGCFNSP